MSVRPASLPGDGPPAAMVATGLAKIGLVLRHEAWRARGASGLTPTQGQILALLRARGEEATLGALAAELGVSAPTASDAVAALVAKGLVRKHRGRTLALALTPAGRREAKRAARWPDVLLEAVDALSPTEQAVFLRGLATMIRVLQERGRIPVARMCATCSFFRPHVHPDPERPHHCAYADVAFGDRQLRLDCADWRAPDTKEVSR
jgi:DNA-binding MarR family transcriptional regulator